MNLAWMVDCKICAQRFAVLRRGHAAGKATDVLPPQSALGQFECPHCHEWQEYDAADLIPSEARILAPRRPPAGSAEPSE
jgi:hypothetical protein